MKVETHSPLSMIRIYFERGDIKAYQIAVPYTDF
jgi:hypothetical protein